MKQYNVLNCVAKPLCGWKKTTTTNNNNKTRKWRERTKVKEQKKYEKKTAKCEHREYQRKLFFLQFRL